MRKASALPLTELEAEIDSLIVSGKTESARLKLAAAPWPRLANARVVVFARLARRLYLPELSVSLLFPIVRMDSKAKREPTPGERAEYAASLIQLGAIKEAQTILHDLKGTAVVEVPLLLAYSLMAQWDYAGAIVPLREFLDSPRLSDYERAVGEANLAAALVHERMPEAHSCLETFLSLTREHHYQRLSDRGWLLLGEWFIAHRQWDRAKESLERVRGFIASAGSLESLFVGKWMAVLDLAQQRSESALDELLKVRAAAKAQRHWETVRDCDYHRAVYLGDEPTFLHLYFGTPYPHYRERLIRDFGREVRLPDSYRWRLGPAKGGTPASVTPQALAETSELREGGLPHRALSALYSDFYRPIRITDLHDRLYPEEYFNPHSSPGRIHQILRRLRAGIEAGGSPLSVEEYKGAYFLSAKRPCLLEIPTGDSRRESLMERLRQRFPSPAVFTTKEASLALNVPVKSLQRIIKSACELGQLHKEGRRRLARYFFK